MRRVNVTSPADPQNTQFKLVKWPPRRLRVCLPRYLAGAGGNAVIKSDTPPAAGGGGRAEAGWAVDEGCHVAAVFLPGFLLNCINVFIRLLGATEWTIRCISNANLERIWDHKIDLYVAGYIRKHTGEICDTFSNLILTVYRRLCFYNKDHRACASQHYILPRNIVSR